MGRQFEKNFFAQVQGKFAGVLGKKTGPDFQGRYIGHVLHALSMQQPKALQCIPSGVRKVPVRCEPEYAYGKARERIADLALFTAGESEPYLLVEIKAADAVNVAHNHPQLRAYADWVRQAPKGKRHVVVLTQYPLPQATRALIAENDAALFECSIGIFADRLAKALPNSELAAMFLEYLYTKGLVMTPLDAQDMEALHTFLTFSFLPHISGQGRVTSYDRITNGPKAFATIVQNWALVSEHYADMLRRGGATVRDPVVKFVAEPFPGEKSGGQWILYSRYLADAANKKQPHRQQNLYHEFGLALAIEKNEDRERKGMYGVWVYSALLTGRQRNSEEAIQLVKKGKDRSRDYGNFGRAVSSQGKLIKALQASVSKAIEKVDDPVVKRRVEAVRTNLLA